MQIIKILNK